jgi:bifunctional non-homologous end joining protein LigD
MALEEYARKRRFADTPEPAPKPVTPPAPSAAPYFCVQRHDASNLHYDFRLEIEGVLKSWAIPKGPTLDPAVRHFAAHVEDHPLEYGDFEGTIPAGNYGAGSVMLWDRGTFELLGDTSGVEQIARGDLKFRLHGEKLNGDFALVRMKGRGKGNEWLILKKRDPFATAGWDVENLAYSVLSGRTQEEIARNLPARQAKRQSAGSTDRTWKSSRPAKRGGPKTDTLASAAPASRSKKKKHDLAGLKGATLAEMPASITPMQAGLAGRPPRGDEWLFEVKWDGVRAIAFVEGEQVRLQSRSGIRCERQYPELATLHHYVAARSTILDGEIAVLDPQGISRFHLIQSRISNSDPKAIAHLVRSTPVIYFAFDLLYLDGYDLRQVALSDRKRLLAEILTPSAGFRVSESFAGIGEEMLDAARATGLEGIIAKRAGSAYESRRSRDWLKIKIVGEQEFLICGFNEGERDYFGALILGFWDEGALAWAGNVGTGFDQKTMRDLRRLLDPLVTPRSPFREPPPVPRATWVKPELVCAVKFSNWTTDNRLRAPVYLGLRNDVDPDQVRREEPDPAAEENREPIPAKVNDASISVNGRTLKLTNLNKVFYPDDGYTKRDILRYYDTVAHLILPHLKDRPLSLKRYPNGIKEEFFFQKNSPESFPAWLRMEEIYSEHNEAPTRFVFAEDRASLLYLVNLGCIDHNPWMSRSPTLDHPDFVLIDLDPQECPFDLIVDAALMVKEALDAVGLAGYPKTTGGDGLHIYVPLETVYTYDESRTFAELIARLVIDRHPRLFTTPRSVAKRQKNRVYFDYLQNGRSKTIAAPYVLRAYPGAPVATPLEWIEVKRALHPSQFTLANTPSRFEAKGDLFSGVLTHPQRLEDALLKLEPLFRR